MKWNYFFITLVVCIALLWGIWPYYSLLALASAFRDGDLVELESRIDWRSVREGLKSDLDSLLLTKCDSSCQATFRPPLSRTTVNQMIDAYVTPAVLVGILDAKPIYVPPEHAVARDVIASIEPVKNEAGYRFDWSQVEYAFFTGPTTFRVDVGTDDGDAVVSGLFGWSGSWRLERVILPFDKM